MGCNKGLRNTLIIGGAVALAVYYYKKSRNQREKIEGNYSPLVDAVNIFEDSRLVEQISFEWDDEERCIEAKSEVFDEEGEVVKTKKLELEYYEDKILIAESNGDEGEVSVFSIFTLNGLGMVSSITNRFMGGQEQRVDLLMNGSELSKVYSTEHEAVLNWEQGNLIGISSNGEIKQKMTYYHNIENHLFPDLNLLVQGLCTEMPMTYLMGTRSRNFLRTMVNLDPNGQLKTTFSYFLDSFDRPIQILMETTTNLGDSTTIQSRECEIIYKKL